MRRPLPDKIPIPIFYDGPNDFNYMLVVHTTPFIPPKAPCAFHSSVGSADLSRIDSIKASRERPAPSSDIETYFSPLFHSASIQILRAEAETELSTRSATAVSNEYPISRIDERRYPARGRNRTRLVLDKRRPLLIPGVALPCGLLRLWRPKDRMAGLAQN